MGPIKNNEIFDPEKQKHTIFKDKVLQSDKTWSTPNEFFPRVDKIVDMNQMEPVQYLESINHDTKIMHKLQFGQRQKKINKFINVLFGSTKKLSALIAIVGLIFSVVVSYPISQVFNGNWKLQQQIEIYTIEKVTIGSKDWIWKSFLGSNTDLTFYFELSGFIFSLRYYALTIFIGLFLGYMLALFLAKKQHIATTVIDRLIIGLIVFGLLGARLFYVAFNWSSFKGNPLLIISAIPQGGLAIFGALIGGFLYLWMYSSRYRFSIWEFLDILSPAILIGQVIGRFGNMFNYEAYGPATTVYWKMFVPASVNYSDNLSDKFFHPTFLYEIIPNFFLLIALLFYYKKLTNKRSGQVFAFYAIGYGAIRFITEFYRVDALKFGLWWPFKFWIWDFNYFYVSQFSAIILILIGLLVYKNRSRIVFLKKSLEEIILV
jgi:phosphatidylglycerol---prolipoprotein diacylglyceryl transferase